MTNLRVSVILLSLLGTALDGGNIAAAQRTRSESKAEAPKSASTNSEKSLGIVAIIQPRSDAVTPPYFFPDIPAPGLQGARLGIIDNNTTGRFVGQKHYLKELLLDPTTDAVAVFKQALTEGYRHILLKLPPELIPQLAALPEAQSALLYDIGTDADRLRGEDCAANVLHLLPSRAMRADALAQYLTKKRWQNLFLAIGPDEADRLYAEAFKRSTKKFGLKIVSEKTWQHSFDERRTPESEVPVFTQGADYDVLIVADEAGNFGDYLSYRTWQPRLVAGTQGLVPAAWHYTLEHWGAMQLQKRFKEQAGYWMTEVDYAGWLAVRAIGEAATRTKSVEFDPIKAFMLGPEFTLAGFKGVPLSFRPWDGQLRQPLLLSGERALVAVAPIEGFLHPQNELDTLGYDRPESLCRPKRP